MTVEQKKPIAVLTDRISRAIDYFQIDTKIKLREIQAPKRRLIGEDGQVYILITDAEQLMGLEIASIMVVPGASRKSDFSRMYDTALTRIR